MSPVAPAMSRKWRGAAPLGIDFSPAMVHLARGRNRPIAFVCGDAQALPLARNTLERAVMNFGLLHLPDSDRALAEARRAQAPESWTRRFGPMRPSRSTCHQDPTTTATPMRRPASA